MATAKQVVAGAATITKIPLSTLTAIQRRFTETGIWPAARGPNVPELSTRNVVHFILGFLADTKGREVADAACRYYKLKNADGEMLGDFLVRVLDSYEDPANSPLAQIIYKSRLVVDCTSPRACLAMEHTDGISDLLFGNQKAQWDDTAVRRSMTIAGRSIFYLGLGLHQNDWTGENYVAA